MAWALNKNTKKGYFDIEFKNGAIIQEDNNLSFAKHNLLCFGRAYKELIPTQEKRSGYIGSYLEKRQLYSLCWVGYINGVINDKTLDFINIEFDSSCNRDFNNNLINKKIKIIDILKTADYEISIKINISEEDLILNL